jgi:serine-type D-Ala-D-Ala carboxypeptidase (penicillin-binding protein 5/6)
MFETPQRRYALIGASIGALLFVVLCSILVVHIVSPTVNALVATPTPTATSTATPTLTPTPTDTPVPSATPIPFVNGSAEYAVDTQTGKAVYSNNIHAHFQMASVTKIMTAMVTIDGTDLTQVIPVTQDELNEVPPGASTAMLQAGDKIRLSDLLYALLLPSGCDAAIVIAHAVAGNTAHFVDMMNAKAVALQMHDTHFSNPHGAINDPGHYSSVADLVTLGRYAMNNPTFAQIVSQQSYELQATINHHDYPWGNTNSLLKNYSGADGVKTGSSDAAGYCLVFSATRKGHRIIGAELGAPSFSLLYRDATNMLDLGFSHI